MNILIRNVPDLDSPFYKLKLCITNYFLTIADGQISDIIKFYGANVSSEKLNRSNNDLFLLLLETYSLKDKLFSDPIKIH